MKDVTQFIERSTATACLQAAVPPSGPWSMARPAASPGAFPTASAFVANRLGRYELQRELGSGGMGTVYEAVDLSRGERVAIKMLPAVDGPRLHRFKREFRSLSGINHPNLVGLGELESDGNHWFFTMDLVEGTDFLSYVRGASPGASNAVAEHGTFDEARLRSALPQLVAAVMTLHGHQIIHRDLKPSNVMVTEAGRVIVLDFGVVMEAAGRDGETSQAGPMEGTPRYMAPEQATGQRITSVADWYAVGVILYEALAGRPPFDGSLRQLLRDKQRGETPALPTDVGLPDDLVQLTMRLLARDPQQRPGPDDIAKAISLEIGMEVGVRSAHSRLVGRAGQLAVLATAYETVVKERQPVIVFIRGRPGVGKTALAETFLDSLRRCQPPITVLSGRCHDRESVPFKALDCLIDALSDNLRSLVRSDVARLLPEDIGLLTHLFPVLGRVDLAAKSNRMRAADLTGQQLRERAFAALRLLLGRLSSQRPIVMFSDDLQCGDADSARALFEVLRPPDAPAILFVGSFRSDDWENSAFQRAWERKQQAQCVTILQRDVNLSPLSPEECTELVVSLVGRNTVDTCRWAREMYAETGGNPFLFLELANFVDPGTDSLRAVSLHEAIDRKLKRLPPGADKVLNMVAESRKAPPVEDICRAMGCESPAIFTITRMCSERLLRLICKREDPLVLVDTYHDRIRETVRSRMEQPKRHARRLAIAEEIPDEIELIVGASPGAPEAAATA